MCKPSLVLLRAYSHLSTSSALFMASVNNPFNMSHKTLMSVFHDFLHNTNMLKKKMEIKRMSATELYNRRPTLVDGDTGSSFLYPNSPESESEDIIMVLWVGCLPYLFPEEEIPICVVMTMTNIYLFRTFVENDNELKNLNTFNDVKEAMHCFYNFPLCSLREVVIGLFDQSLRVEVAAEGPRGTFLFLTRDASKTAQFLDSLFSALGRKKNTRGSSMNFYQQKNSSTDFPLIIYPDESKFDMLKTKIQMLGHCFEERESFLSYCIIYNRDEDESGYEIHDDVTLPYLRTLILTDYRLILCDEDYVRWPLPSYVCSLPLTPQWVLDAVEVIENVIGIDLWDDTSGKQNMTGCYGITLTFEGKTEKEEIEVDFNNVWNLLFQSLSEREQFVRSISCLWKNRFNEDIRVTFLKKVLSLKKPKSTVDFVKGHAKKPSGGISIPPMQKLDSPEMFIRLDKARLNSLFSEKIAQGDDKIDSSVLFVTCVGCKPYNYPHEEFIIALILGKFNIYMIASQKYSNLISANNYFQDGGDTNLYFNVMEINKLKQVAVGLFDQCFRLEMETPLQTFIFVTRNSDHTNDFIQELSQAILALPQQIDEHEETIENVSATNQIFKIYQHNNGNDRNYYPQSEFVHPNSCIRFVYPTDETLEKLCYEIRHYIHVFNLPQADNFGVLIYSLLFHIVDNIMKSCNLVISEKFLCLVNEDNVNYPLPLFVKELPERCQYKVFKLQFISALLRIEFDEFHSGIFSLVFNNNIDTSFHGSMENSFSEENKFRTETVEVDTCLVSYPAVDEDEDCLRTWTFNASSYMERDKIFGVLSRMWSNNFSGRTLSVIRKKCK